MNLEQAQRYADRIAALLQPYCNRIAIAGSIRRERPICNDVDVVCIPKTEAVTNLFGETISKRNLLHEFLTSYIATKHYEGFKWLQGKDLKPDSKQLLIDHPKVQIDLWLADEHNWGTRLLCRTGSKEHNIWLSQRAMDYGCHWQIYDGLLLPVGPVPPPGSRILGRSEEEIYAALHIPFIPPNKRDLEYSSHWPHQSH